MTQSGLHCLKTDRPALAQSFHAPAGSRGYYGMAVPFQVGPCTAGIMVNVRDVGERGADHVDFEVGTDAVLFDEIASIDAARAIPVSRNHDERNPHTDELGVMVKYPVQVGFIPLGAPHPHAGTGLGLCHAVCWPQAACDRLADGTLRAYGGEQAHQYIELMQLRYDGEQLHVREPLHVDENNWLDGHHLGFVGITPPVPDDDDLLFPMHGCREHESDLKLGVARWRRIDDTWRPVEWYSVADVKHHGEMSMVRDVDGSLLYSARPDTALTCHNMHVWRSTDNGVTWNDLLKIQWIRSAAPVTINQAADGTPYMLANLYETPLVGTADTKKVPVTPTGWHMVGGYQRNKLYAWPLSDDRSNLEPPVLVRDCDSDFGPPPGGTTWSADHAMALTVRLGDGRWHNVLTYRVLERGENGMACPPTDHTGCYVQEVQTHGPARPLWPFIDE